MLHTAYYDARRHKRWKAYQLAFEYRLEENLAQLEEELLTRTYRPQPSTCFVITDPKPREVFAASFRDRIVHHLYYNLTHEMFERTFIADTYSCIKHRGTHYGIDRLEQHIRQESRNYTRPCYVLKLDIRGYFMHINREKLLSLALASLDKMATHRVSRHSPEVWGDRVDMDFVRYLTRELTLLNPLDGCRRIGKASDWDILPPSKTLFASRPGCGLPIGNLTSQLFSNVYLNPFDHFMKRTMGCRHYGRYVDDSYVVSCDRDYLHSLIPEVRRFLAEELGLSLHDGKLRICDVRQGVEFLGAYLKPHRRYVSNETLRRMESNVHCSLCNVHLLRSTPYSSLFSLFSSLNSYLGVLGHYKSRGIQRRLFLTLNAPWLYGRFVRTKRGYKFIV